MELEDGLRVRASIKRGNRNDAPTEGSYNMGDGDAGNDTEDSNTEQEASPPGRVSSMQGRGASRIGMRQPLPTTQEDVVGREHNKEVNRGK